jgi:hypothetical protein
MTVSHRRGSERSANNTPTNATARRFALIVRKAGALH